MVQWTKEQEAAIYTSGKDVLVAAAAGSGKTAVLVERIIQKLLNKENPVDIDSLLVVTFTNAAAQEMRNRVGAALENAVAADPTSIHLKKQLSLLQRASISTLHSFCLDVVKQHAYLLDLDPAFRIANEMEADLLKQEVMEDLFEKWYGADDIEQEGFFDVVDRFSNDRSDAAVEELILSLYHFAIQNPWPDAWLDDLATAYDIKEEWKESELAWLEIIKREVRSQFAALHDEMQLAMNIANEADGPYHYIDTIEKDLAGLQGALDLLDNWDDLQEYMSSSTFVRLSGKKMECDERKKEKVKNLRDSYKKRWNKMKDQWFKRNLSSHVEDMQEMAPVVEKLTSLVKTFKDQFTSMKKEKAIVDFSDLEHYCLELFLDDSATSDKLVPSKVARYYRDKFSELLIDEYQDTNLVQETLLTLISDRSGPGNMFMVGDVKQSIYRFRHAEPNLFIQKYRSFAEAASPAERIDLARNFRSREHVLTGANYIFRQILDQELGEIDYDEDAELIYGNKTYDEMPYVNPNPELVIIDREAEENTPVSEEEEDYQDLEKAQLEARVFAEKIKTWIGQKGGKPLQVVDKATGMQRDFQYRDAVILLRAMSNWGPVIVEELKKQGIPVYAELSTGYFDAIEVKVMISFLKVIDNPRQDIPLASVLRSPIAGLNEEELAAVRLAERGSYYYDALKKYIKINQDNSADKITSFLEKLEKFRFASRQGALSELIWHIYMETGYYDFVGGMPGGRQRQANLRALYDRARTYEETSFRGLFRFLRFIERMEENNDDLGAARALSEQEDVVRIMTIHKSKGLEFPVVMMGAMDKQFNLMDLNQQYLLHKEMGFASKYIDPVKRITYPTLFYHALKQEKKRELLSEEMRVLYVALTRAKEKLVMVGNVNSLEDKLKKWERMMDHGEWVLPAHFRMESKTYLDWVGPALIRHKDNDVLRSEEQLISGLNEINLDPSKWDVSVMHGSELANLDESRKEKHENLRDVIVNWKKAPVSDENLERKVDHRLSFEYALKEATKLRAKQTVTEIKRQREIKDEYSADQLVQQYKAPIVKRPNFMQKEKTITSAEKGTAMHTVMQHIPMEKALKEEEIAAFVESLKEKEILTEEQAAIIDHSAIASFFTTPISEYMREVEPVYREVPFSLTLPANEVYAGLTADTEEQVLIQGVIDCLIPKDDGWIILDYKTDAIPEETDTEMKASLIKRYETQLNLYRQAVEQIWRQPVKEAYLYFFSGQLLLEVPGE
ncbi:helicase-exonuclease AddAB subunit AddA [Virgibacillus kimchii]